jgi:hypothetical protein
MMLSKNLAEEKTPWSAQGKARETREMRDVQPVGAEKILMERARVPGDLIHQSRLVNGNGNGGGMEKGMENGNGSVRALDEASALPAPLENASKSLMVQL